jgi:hypothetical protein
MKIVQFLAIRNLESWQPASIQETTLNIYMDACNIYTHIISIEEDTVSRLAHKRSDGLTSLLYL